LDGLEGKKNIGAIATNNRRGCKVHHSILASSGLGCKYNPQKYHSKKSKQLNPVPTRPPLLKICIHSLISIPSPGRTINFIRPKIDGQTNSINKMAIIPIPKPANQLKLYLLTKLFLL
jgi:hypothetical protein